MCQFPFSVPAVADVEVGGHDRSREQSGMSPSHSINHGGYRPPVDMSGNTHAGHHPFFSPWISPIGVH